MDTNNNKKVNEDLQKERLKCDFNVEEFTHLWDGGADLTKRRREIENKVLSINGILGDGIPEDYLSHKEKYEQAIKKAVLYYKAKRDIIDSEKLDFYSLYSRNRRLCVEKAVFKNNTPFMVHYAMFLPTLRNMADEEQQKKWLKRAVNLEILGTYAQTELGHGTFLRGLETTATYDSNTEHFIINSPQLSAYKFWPGNLGHTANYCILMAQLITGGKARGLHAFLVQIRDEETHMPLPGVTVGEMGPKIGYNTVNNGFLGFKNYRLPRDQMLMRNAQVLKDDTYRPSGHAKLAYGTMVFVRVTILDAMTLALASAATIAVRYAAVRHQSKIKPNEPEVPIIDFVTQQDKLFMAIAAAHAYMFVGVQLWDMYVKVTTDLHAGRFDDLPELHAKSSGLKAFSTKEAQTLIERCRLSCGGHGYLLNTGLPQIYSNVSAAFTYEGEYTVLMLQSARYLVKSWHKAASGESLTDSVAYLRDKSRLPPWDGSVDTTIKYFQRVAASKLAVCVSTLKKHTDAGDAPEIAWNKTSVQLVETSQAHSLALVLLTYKTALDSIQVSPSLKKVMMQLNELYAVSWTLQTLGDLLLYTTVSEKDVIDLRLRYVELLQALRPNAVSLVDAFDIRDEVLGSSLGSYDGRAYERLMEEAMKSPLNQEPVNQTFHTHLKPFLKGKL